MAERYDVESMKPSPPWKQELKSMEDRLRSTVSGYSSLVLETKTLHFLKLMLYACYLFMLINKFKGKIIFIINGQTGKVVGDTPISRLRQFVCYNCI